MGQEKSKIDRLQRTLALESKVSHVDGVSANRASVLRKLNIETVRDLVTHYPRRYLDLTNVTTIAQARIGEQCTIAGQIHAIELKRRRRNLQIVEISLVDETGLLIVSVFHQPWLMDKMHVGDHIAIAGKVEFNYGYKRMTNPFMEQLAGEKAEGRIIPIHPATEKISPAWMRRLVANALEGIFGVLDPLPSALRQKHDLMSRNQALQAIHLPKSMDEAAQAKRRLVYEELLMLELFMMQQEHERTRGLEPVRHIVDGAHLQALRAALPFALTSEQEQAAADILEALSAQKVANHLLLGDVGTGKTVIAAIAMAAAKDTGGQALLLAPTEVLARQHAKTLGSLFEAAGMSFALLTGSTSAPEREAAIKGVASGAIDVLIGTHALLEDDVSPTNMTLAIIDEQQRFGVNQRAKLLAKGAAPDALYLTATPIPRSLALTLFGNLTLSYLKERPGIAAKRKTHVVRKTERGKAYDAAREALKGGHQAYVVCPLIGAQPSSTKKSQRDGIADDGYYPDVAIDDISDFTSEDLSSAKQEAEFLQKRVFPEYAVGLLHGKMTAQEKQEVMDAFQQGALDVLVSTTVIEVGVDVPNATVMIIEDADRFGLSQLHQLRGRVGRGGVDSEVYLVSATNAEAALARLNAMVKSDDGFKIAAYDLSLRREGDILGNKQSGTSALKLVNVIRDASTIEMAHADAAEIIAVDPDLDSPDHAALARELRILFTEEKSAIGG